ncbi:MAG: hypothetical protein NT069_16495, partial [Planctomycetota bacterium]|nr:hypothetical protein [Planctomycetota bacterium]
WRLGSAPRSRFSGVVALGLGLILGCGSEDYQDRLDTTAKYFESIELQNAHLHGPWVDSATSISLRLPLQFVELPPPELGTTDPSAAAMPTQSAPAVNAAQGEEEEEEEEEEEPATTNVPKFGDARPAPRKPVEEDSTPDPRQPQFLNTPLPGIRGAFKAPLAVVAAGGRTAVGSGYVYVLSNHHLASSHEEAGRFHTDLIALLSSALGVTIKGDEVRQTTLPQRPNAFLKPVDYKELELEPAEQDGEMAREFGVATRFSLHLHSDGDVQVAVLFVLPRDLDVGELFPTRRTLSLETLRIDNPILTKPGGGAAVPSASGSSF